MARPERIRFWILHERIFVTLYKVFRGEIARHSLRHCGFVMVAVGHDPAADRRHYFVSVYDCFLLIKNNGNTFFVDAIDYFHNIDIVFFFHFYNRVNIP